MGGSRGEDPCGWWGDAAWAKRWPLISGSLRKVIQISPDTLENLLAALVAAGQDVVVQVNGQRVFRATM